MASATGFGTVYFIHGGLQCGIVIPSFYARIIFNSYLVHVIYQNSDSIEKST